ncbi:MAG: four-carbon acid sugar kinase family protein, partial [Anaerolineae bacterium]|nr:four-carbon acid sugar kinase family protein [Anaerolineae bacterium]
LGAPFFHYKICSTFDSSPTVGSIGHATEIGMRVFQSQVVPMMVGAPALRRYVAYSNLFARVDDETYRLDRHPTMSKHPITPMTESDLRLHLAQQTDLPIGAMTLWHMEKEQPEVDAYFARLMEEGAKIVLFDSINHAHLYMIGRLVWGMKNEHPVLLVGSSGFEYALRQYWIAEGIVPLMPPPAPVPPVKQLIVMSGSAAPATSAQITWAMNNGYAAIRLNSADLIDPDTADAERERVTREALMVLEQGKSVVLYSTHGSADPAIAETKQRMERLNLGDLHVGSLLGAQQGRILKELLSVTRLRRAVVCGGDTCGYSAQQLGIYALRAMMPFAPGAPLCRAYAEDPRFDGLEINLKAGQIGRPDFFEAIRTAVY